MLIYTGHLISPPEQPCKVKFIEVIYLFVYPEQHHLLLLSVLSDLTSVITSCPRPLLFGWVADPS